MTRVQVNVGVLTSVGVGLLTTSVAVGATTFSLGGIDSVAKLGEYGAYYFFMSILLILGTLVLGSAKKFMNEQLHQLMAYGALEISKPEPIEKESTEKTSKLTRLRRFWVCKGNNPEAPIDVRTRAVWKS